MGYLLWIYGAGSNHYTICATGNFCFYLTSIFFDMGIVSRF